MSSNWIAICSLILVSAHHSTTSQKLVTLLAKVGNIWHFQSFKTGNPSEGAISGRVTACSMFCLFANITKMALKFFTFWYGNNSDLEMPAWSWLQLSYYINDCIYVWLITSPVWPCPSKFQTYNLKEKKMCLCVCVKKLNPKVGIVVVTFSVYNCTNIVGFPSHLLLKLKNPHFPEF